MNFQTEYSIEFTPQYLQKVLRSRIVVFNNNFSSRGKFHFDNFHSTHYREPVSCSIKTALTHSVRILKIRFMFLCKLHVPIHMYRDNCTKKISIAVAQQFDRTVNFHHFFQHKSSTITHNRNNSQPINV